MKCLASTEPWQLQDWIPEGAELQQHHGQRSASTSIHASSALTAHTELEHLHARSCSFVSKHTGRRRESHCNILNPEQAKEQLLIRMQAKPTQTLIIYGCGQNSRKHMRKQWLHLTAIGTQSILIQSKNMKGVVNLHKVWEKGYKV